MAQMQSSAGKKIAITASVVVVAAVAVYAVAFRGDNHDSTLPPDLQPEALRAQAEKDTGSVFRKMRETMDRDDLTDEQRRELRQNMRESMESMIDERVDEYYAAAEEKREEVLDRHIDDFQERMEQWRKDREEWEKERARRDKESSGNRGGGGNEARAGTGGGSANGQNSGDRRRDGWRSRMRESTPSERKARSESRDPDKTARRMSYFGAMMKRASDRGIEMPGPGGRGGRGPGGEGRGR